MHLQLPARSSDTKLNQNLSQTETHWQSELIPIYVYSLHTLCEEHVTTHVTLMLVLHF